MSKKKKHQNQSRQSQPQTQGEIVAHYLIPTYNLVGNAVNSHTIKSCYGDKDVDVNVWLVQAVLCDEQHSIQEALVQQRLMCDFQKMFAQNDMQVTKVNKDIAKLDGVIMMNKDPGFEHCAGDSLKEVAAQCLDKINAVYNLKCAKLVAGIAK